jgi:hypothetical protein
VYLGDIVQREAFRNIKALSLRLKRLVDDTRRLELCLSGNIIAADEKHPRVLKDKLPDRNLRSGCICGTGCNRTALRERLYVRVDVRGKRHLDDVVHALWVDARMRSHQAVTRQQGLMRTYTRQAI